MYTVAAAKTVTNQQALVTLWSGFHVTINNDKFCYILIIPIIPDKNKKAFLFLWVQEEKILVAVYINPHTHYSQKKHNKSVGIFH